MTAKLAYQVSHPIISLLWPTRSAAQQPYITKGLKSCFHCKIKRPVFTFRRPVRPIHDWCIRDRPGRVGGRSSWSPEAKQRTSPRLCSLLQSAKCARQNLVILPAVTYFFLWEREESDFLGGIPCDWWGGGGNAGVTQEFFSHGTKAVQNPPNCCIKQLCL